MTSKGKNNMPPWRQMTDPERPRPGWGSAANDDYRRVCRVGRAIVRAAADRTDTRQATVAGQALEALQIIDRVVNFGNGIVALCGMPSGKWSEIVRRATNFHRFASKTTDWNL